jgi:hypothetical protein
VTFYTYIHKKKDTGEVFYVGKGCGKRAFDFIARNRYWKFIYKKHGFLVEIIKMFDIEKKAFDHERKLISTYLKKGCKLANVTSGGEGVSGYKHTISALNKLSELAKKQKHSSERRKKLSERISGSKHHFWGKFGASSPNFKGPITGINKITGEKIILNGLKHTKSIGFRYDKVLKCVNGQKKTYRGFIFFRETKELQPAT